MVAFSDRTRVGVRELTLRSRSESRGCPGQLSAAHPRRVPLTRYGPSFDGESHPDDGAVRAGDSAHLVTQAFDDGETAAAHRVGCGHLPAEGAHRSVVD